MELSSHQPIGIFDSGLGGLTVAAAIRNLLPNEQLIYFGDTAHLPYGDKSSATVRYYSTHITDFLVSRGCKVVLIACNTASAAAFESIQSKFGNKTHILDVINPIVEHTCRDEQIKKLGIIGTKGTVNSGTYPRKLLSSKPNMQVSSMATPLFVPMIEEGFVYDDISNAIIRSYLSDERLRGIDALILGCTHYPIIKNQIRKFFDFKVKVIDSSQIVALSLKQLLEKQGLVNTSEKIPTHEFFVSDYTETFETMSQMFFDDHIRLQKIDLWQHEKVQTID